MTYLTNFARWMNALFRLIYTEISQKIYLKIKMLISFYLMFDSVFDGTKSIGGSLILNIWRQIVALDLSWASGELRSLVLINILTWHPVTHSDMLHTDNLLQLISKYVDSWKLNKTRFQIYSRRLLKWCTTFAAIIRTSISDCSNAYDSHLGSYTHKVLITICSHWNHCMWSQ